MPGTCPQSVAQISSYFAESPGALSGPPPFGGHAAWTRVHGWLPPRHSLQTPSIDGFGSEPAGRPGQHVPGSISAPARPSLLTRELIHAGIVPILWVA